MKFMDWAMIGWFIAMCFIIYILYKENKKKNDKQGKADEIWNKIITEWKKRYDKANQLLDPKKVEATKYMVYNLPDLDGCKRVTSMESGKTHLVPVEDIILMDEKGSEITKYPVVKELWCEVHKQDGRICLDDDGTKYNHCELIEK